MSMKVDLIDKNVEIEWRTDCDWFHFKVLDIDDMFIKLKGISNPITKAKHAGNIFWQNLSEISAIVEL
jgi:hypothetical protein